MKTILGLFGLFLLVLGFLGWRLNFNTPFMGTSFYIWSGLALLISLLIGKVAGKYLMGISLIPFAIFLFGMLFDKGRGWSDYYPFFGLWVIGSVIGAVLYGVGSEKFESNYETEKAHDRKDVFCASCSQLLGSASNFDSPCPRCGSNRYNFED